MATENWNSISISIQIHLLDPQSQFSRKGLMESTIFVYGILRLFVLNAYVKRPLIHWFFHHNIQLISYAGYTMADGSVIGDPINIEITEVT